MDECQDSPCQQGCRNTIGSYACYCNPGYIFTDQSTCQPVPSLSGGTAFVQSIIEETEPNSVEPDKNVDVLTKLVSAKAAEMAKVAIEQTMNSLKEEMESMVDNLDEQLETVKSPEEAVEIVGNQLDQALKARVSYKTSCHISVSDLKP